MVGLRTGPVPTSLMGAEGYGTKTPFGPHCGGGVTGGSGGSQRDIRDRVACVTEGKREGALATCLFLASSRFGGVDSFFYWPILRIGLLLLVFCQKSIECTLRLHNLLLRLRLIG